MLIQRKMFWKDEKDNPSGHFLWTLYKTLTAVVIAMVYCYRQCNIGHFAEDPGYRQGTTTAASTTEPKKCFAHPETPAGTD